MNRNRMVAGAMGLVVAAGGVGWVAGATITSPADAAANADAPEPSLITVAVDQRVLSADIIARGSISYSDPVQLSVEGSTGGEETQPIVTGVAAVGDELAEGDVALEVSGRPVFVLRGDLPVFRDLRPGATGLDVLQLEEALVRLGHLEQADERWDSRTGAALQAMYDKAGYEANAASDADRDALKAAREGVRSAQQFLADAQQALKDADSGPGSAAAAAKAALENAKDAVVVAKAERTSAIAAANNEVDAALAARTLAEADRTLAQQRYNQAVDTNVHPDTGLPPTAVELAELNQALQDAQLEYTQRHNAYLAAQSAVTTTVAQQDALVAAAQREVTVAQANYKEATKPVDKRPLQRAVDDARRQVSDALAELARVEASIGTWLPSGEVVYVNMTPVQVTNVTVRRGSMLSGPFMTVSGADIRMTVALQEVDARRISVGDRVILDDPDYLETPLEGTVGEIPEGSSGGRVQITVDLEEIPEFLMGANMRVTIPVSSTEGEVLVVPAAALSAVANGDTRVEVEDPDNPGETRFVTVVTGLAADGVVEVRAVDGSLNVGDRVVVGVAGLPPGAGSDDDEDEEEPDEEADG